MDPRTEQMFTREQYDRIVRGEAIPGAAGMPLGTQVAERGFARATDGDAVFKAALAKVYDAPMSVMKHESPVIRADDSEIATDPATQARRVTNLILKALDDAGVWDPMAENQATAKALRKNVGLGERGDIFFENGAPIIRISKAA